MSNSCSFPERCSAPPPHECGGSHQRTLSCPRADTEAPSSSSSEFFPACPAPDRLSATIESALGPRVSPLPTGLLALVPHPSLVSHPSLEAAFSSSAAQEE